MVGVGIPNVLYFGAYGGYKYLVMDILGSTLHDLKELTGKNKLFGKTIAKIAIQAVNYFLLCSIFALLYILVIIFNHFF